MVSRKAGKLGTFGGCSDARAAKGLANSPSWSAVVVGGSMESPANRADPVQALCKGDVMKGKERQSPTRQLPQPTRGQEVEFWKQDVEDASEAGGREGRQITRSTSCRWASESIGPLICSRAQGAGVILLLTVCGLAAGTGSWWPGQFGCRHLIAARAGFRRAREKSV